MEIDAREIPPSEHLERALSAFSDLERGEVLTLLLQDDPQGLMESMENVLGGRVDLQKIRWGIKDLGWLLHLKKSLRASAYQPPG